MIRWILYPLVAFFAIASVANLVTGDVSEFLVLLGLLFISGGLLAIYEIFSSRRHQSRMAELKAWRGLARCPLGDEELRELFEYLDRPDPPPCSHRFLETAEFLRSRNIEVKPVVKWLLANGAGCDCEVIFNTAQRYGGDVGFEPEGLDDSELD